MALLLQGKAKGQAAPHALHAALQPGSGEEKGTRLCRGWLKQKGCPSRGEGDRTYQTNKKKSTKKYSSELKEVIVKSET